MRRIAGILSIFLLVHLSLGAGDFACASHAQQVTGSGPQHHAGMQMDGAHRSDACNTSQKDCSTTDAPACCTAMASCATVFVARIDANAFVASQGTSNPFTDLLTPSSGPTGPDTPPPRA